jgi:hypothetical protein
LPLVTIVIMAVASALTVANVYFNQALLPAIATGFSVSPREAGFVATLSQLGYALGIVLVVPLGAGGTAWASWGWMGVAFLPSSVWRLLLWRSQWRNGIEIKRANRSHGPPQRHTFTISRR